MSPLNKAVFEIDQAKGLIEALEGGEGVWRPWHFLVTVAVPIDAPYHQWVSCRAAIRFEGQSGAVRVMTGEILKTEGPLSCSVETQKIQISLGSVLHRCALSGGTHFFKDCHLREIVRLLLEKHRLASVPVEWSGNLGLKRYPLLQQWPNESDWQFIKRCCGREGISALVIHSGQEKLCFVDDSQGSLYGTTEHTFKDSGAVFFKRREINHTQGKKKILINSLSPWISMGDRCEGLAEEGGTQCWVTAMSHHLKYGRDDAQHYSNEITLSSDFASDADAVEDTHCARPSFGLGFVVSDRPYSDLDAHGRYRVAFLADSEASKQADYHLTRLQGHGGVPSEQSQLPVGFHALLYSGTELLLGPLDANADDVSLVGPLPNVEQRASVEKTHQDQFGWGTPGGVRLKFQDRAKEQTIQWHSIKNNHRLVLGGSSQTEYQAILASKTGKIQMYGGQDISMTAGGTMDERVANCKQVIVQKKENVSTEQGDVHFQSLKSFSCRVEQNLTVQSGGDFHLQVASGITLRSKDIQWQGQRQFLMQVQSGYAQFQANVLTMAGASGGDLDMGHHSGGCAGLKIGAGGKITVYAQRLAVKTPELSFRGRVSTDIVAPDTQAASSQPGFLEVRQPPVLCDRPDEIEKKAFFQEAFDVFDEKAQGCFEESAWLNSEVRVEGQQGIFSDMTMEGESEEASESIYWRLWNFNATVINHDKHTPSIASRLPLFPQRVVDVTAGYGDGVSLGVTQWIREKIGVDHAVNNSSDLYNVGLLAGVMTPLGGYGRYPNDHRKGPVIPKSGRKSDIVVGQRDKGRAQNNLKISSRELSGSSLKSNTNQANKVTKHPGPYSPDRQLPQNKKSGISIPDPEFQGRAHTQLGTVTREKKGYSYTKAREFDEHGKAVRDIEFTDHHRKDHPNPHQHPWKPNETGGTLKRGDAEPLDASLKDSIEALTSKPNLPRPHK